MSQNDSVPGEYWAQQDFPTYVAGRSYVAFHDRCLHKSLLGRGKQRSRSVLVELVWWLHRFAVVASAAQIFCYFLAQNSIFHLVKLSIRREFFQNAAGDGGDWLQFHNHNLIVAPTRAESELLMRRVPNSLGYRHPYPIDRSLSLHQLLLALKTTQHSL